MNCLVIGGGGFLGSHLVTKLLAEGHSVSVLDIPKSPNIPFLEQLGASIIKGSFYDDHVLGDSLTNQEIVFHLVSTSTPVSSNNNPIVDVEQNLTRTIKLLQLSHQAGIRKVLFSSSGGTVYGIPKSVPITELHPTNPICSYGIVKLAIEKYLYLFWELYGLDYVVLRISNAYGERQVNHGNQGLIPVIIDSGLKNVEIVVRGNGDTVRDYIYCDDITNAFIRAMNYQGDQKVFNIGSGVGYSVNQVLEFVQDYLPFPLKIKYTQANNADVPKNVLNISLAKKKLLWAPKMNMSKGIKNTVEWYASTYHHS